MNLNTFSSKLLDLLSSNPNFCVLNGLNKNNSDLPDPGKNFRISYQGKLKMLMNTLDRIIRESDDSVDGLTVKMLKSLLQSEWVKLEVEIDGIPKDMRMPRALDGIIAPILTLLIQDQRPEKIRLAHIISRLQKVDNYLTSYTRNLRAPVKRWVEMELENIASLDAFYESIYLFAKEIDFKNIDLLNKAIQTCKSAVFKYEVFLKNTEYSTNIHIGEDNAKKVLASLGMTTNLDTHFIQAKEFSQRIEKDLKVLKTTLIKKYNLDEISDLELQDYLNSKYIIGKDQQVLDAYQREQHHICEKLKKMNVFPEITEHALDIKSTPDYLRNTIPAGAMFPPINLQEGIKKSIIYLTLDGKDNQGHTELSIPTMMVHEGIPGHHLQLASASKLNEFYKKIFLAGDCAEGWTTYLEEYVFEIGLFDNHIEEMKFILLRELNRISARVFIDLYFMTGDVKYLNYDGDSTFSSADPFENAAIVLKHFTGFSDERIQGELNWYSQESGYPLSYLYGKIRFSELKEIYKNKHLSSTDLDFHSWFLSQGNIPLDFLIEDLKQSS